MHVYDADGEKELRTINIDDPMAIAVSANGALLAVIAPEDFGNAKATSVALFDTTTFTELAREPLQTDKTIEAALFAAGDQALIALSRGSLFEKPLSMTQAGQADDRRRERPDAHGHRLRRPDQQRRASASPTAAAPRSPRSPRPTCSSSPNAAATPAAAFSGSNRRVTPASLYGVDAYAIAYDRASNTLVVTDRAGFLTIYKVPRAAVAK